MAYTTINKSSLNMNTKLYNGTGSNQSITGVGFKPDWIWGKTRSSAQRHVLTDVVRGINKQLASDTTAAETSYTNSFTAFGSDGFSVGTDNGTNMASQTQVAWNWIGANPPKKTYVVKVVSDGGNKYRLDDFAANAVTLELSEGGTFIFDQSDSSNNGHPLRFSTTSNGTHAGGSIYTTGVVVSGTPGQAGAKTTITVAASAPTLYYFCTVHSGMGGQANTPTTNSFTNLDGSKQSNVSPNTISRFSIVSYTGNETNSTIGHGLGVVPKMIMIKNLSNGGAQWVVYHVITGNTQACYLNTTTTPVDVAAFFQDTTPTPLVFTIGTDTAVNGNNNNMIAYCFGDVQGYSKFGSYTGNGNADGPFTYTGFKPAFVLLKRTDVAKNWYINDNKRLGYNPSNPYLSPNLTATETGGTEIDMLSHGFKITASGTGHNQSNGTYIYMAFAEHPFTSSARTPVTAR